MKNLVVFTGAGVSAESGLKTFRGEDGLWEGYNVEDVATIDAWHRNPDIVLEFYNQRRRQVKAAQPNAAHKALAEMESHFQVTVVTQNIDDLHERAGSTRVIHLHGEIMKMKSEYDDHLVFPIEEDIKPGALAPDGGRLRPDVVWFGEPVPRMYAAMELVQSADIFVVAGTSLMVYPAASLLGYAPQSCLRYIVDKKIPYQPEVYAFHCIEKPASEGMVILKEKLMSLV